MNDKKNTSYPKEKINILFLENISDTAVKQLKDQGYSSVRKLNGALSEEQLIKEVKDVHLLGIRSKTQITANVLKAANKLQAIGCFCIGVNQVDLKAATKLGVSVFNAPYSNTRSVAELVIGLSIMLIRRIPDKNKGQRPEWNSIQLTSQSQGNDQADQYHPAQGSSKPVGHIGSFKSTHRVMIPEND